MTTGQHQGKLVLKAPSGDGRFGIHGCRRARPLLDPDATYLVSGGLGGFGLRLLPYLAFCGRAPCHASRPRPRPAPQDRRLDPGVERPGVHGPRDRIRHRPGRRVRGRGCPALHLPAEKTAERRLPPCRNSGRPVASTTSRPESMSDGLHSQGRRRTASSPGHLRPGAGSFCPVLVHGFHSSAIPVRSTTARPARFWTAWPSVRHRQGLALP